MDITSVKKLDPSDMRLGTAGLSLAFLQPFRASTRSEYTRRTQSSLTDQVWVRDVNTLPLLGSL